uniref:Uncharacterized protein n=1 Tax=Arundo donax TaxID=35708 RepID=A0A0A9FXM5_ARUDO
MGRNRNPTRN